MSRPPTPTRAVLALTAALALGAAPAAQTCDGAGWRLRACLRAQAAPPALLSAEDARRALFETVDVLTRLDSTLVVDSTFVEADSTWHLEETWERFTVRSVRALDGPDEVVPDAAQASALGWTVWTAEPGVREPDAHAVGTPLPPSALPAPVNDHLDLHAAWPSRSGGEPTDDRRGDLARGALYVRTVYPLHVEAAGPWPASGVLLSADLPPSSPGTGPTPRTTPSASGRRAPPPPRAAPPTPTSSTPTSSRVPSHPARRVVPHPPPAPSGSTRSTPPTTAPTRARASRSQAPPGPTSSGTGSCSTAATGEPYDPYDPAVSAAPALSGALPAEGALGAAWLPARGLWNRCNGVALVDPDGRVSHFLSYGGCRFNAVAGPVHALAALDGADDPAHPDSLLWTTPVRGPGWRPVQEWTRMPAGYSIQLTGAGTRRADFAWGGPHRATPGRLGDYQAGGSARRAASNPTSGWTAGDPVPLGLPAPATDDGPNQDAPWQGDTTPPCQCPLALGPPAPQPRPLRRHRSADRLRPARRRALGRRPRRARPRRPSVRRRGRIERDGSVRPRRLRARRRDLRGPRDGRDLPPGRPALRRRALTPAPPLGCAPPSAVPSSAVS